MRNTSQRMSVTIHFLESHLPFLRFLGMVAMSRRTFSPRHWSKFLKECEGRTRRYKIVFPYFPIIIQMLLFLVLFGGFFQVKSLLLLKFKPLYLEVTTTVIICLHCIFFVIYSRSMSLIFLHSTPLRSVSSLIPAFHFLLGFHLFPCILLSYGNLVIPFSCMIHVQTI